MKVVVFDDDIGSILCRYKNIAKRHEVSAYYIELTREMESIDRKIVEDVGINVTPVAFTDPEQLSGLSMPEADLYIIDGLRGLYMKVMQTLPGERSYLVSFNTQYCKEAKKSGFRSILLGKDFEKELEALIKRAENKS